MWTLNKSRFKLCNIHKNGKCEEFFTQTFLSKRKENSSLLFFCAVCRSVCYDEKARSGRYFSRMRMNECTYNNHGYKQAHKYKYWYVNEGWVRLFYFPLFSAFAFAIMAWLNWPKYIVDSIRMEWKNAYSHK